MNILLDRLPRTDSALREILTDLYQQCAIYKRCDGNKEIPAVRIAETSGKLSALKRYSEQQMERYYTTCMCNQVKSVINEINDIIFNASNDEYTWEQIEAVIFKQVRSITGFHEIS